MQAYPSHKSKVSSGVLVNEGWRINLRNWEKLFQFPSPGMRKVLGALEKSPIPFKIMEVVLDPEWHGRFGNCIDGSPVMYTASLQFNPESKGYIDLRGMRDGNKGANTDLYLAKDEYCKRNNIPLLVLHGEYSQGEMQYKIMEFIRNNSDKLK
jgi:hypothetical protein